MAVERPRRSRHAGFVVYLKRPAAILAILTAVGVAAHSTQTPIGPMPTARGSILESSTVPAWLYAFSTVQLELAAFLLLSRDALPNESLGLRISVGEGLSPSRRPLRAVMRPDYSFRGRGANGVVMTGDIEISPDDRAQHPDERDLLISVVLLDNKGRLLDVLAGSRAWRSDSNMQHVEFDSFLPIGRRVRSVQAYVEAVSDIK